MTIRHDKFCLILSSAWQIVRCSLAVGEPRERISSISVTARAKINCAWRKGEETWSNRSIFHKGEIYWGGEGIWMQPLMGNWNFSQQWWRIFNLPVLLCRKVKCTLVRALRLCTGRTAHRGSRGIALLFHDRGIRKEVRGQRHDPAAFYLRERPGTHCTGGWVGLRAGLDRCGKSRPHRDSIPGPSSP